MSRRGESRNDLYTRKVTTAEQLSREWTMATANSIYIEVECHFTVVHRMIWDYWTERAAGGSSAECCLLISRLLAEPKLELGLPTAHLMWQFNSYLRARCAERRQVSFSFCLCDCVLRCKNWQTTEQKLIWICVTRNSRVDLLKFWPWPWSWPLTFDLRAEIDGSQRGHSCFRRRCTV